MQRTLLLHILLYWSEKHGGNFSLVKLECFHTKVEHFCSAHTRVVAPFHIFYIRKKLIRMIGFLFLLTKFWQYAFMRWAFFEILPCNSYRGASTFHNIGCCLGGAILYNADKTYLQEKSRSKCNGEIRKWWSMHIKTDSLVGHKWILLNQSMFPIKTELHGGNILFRMESLGCFFPWAFCDKKSFKIEGKTFLWALLGWGKRDCYQGWGIITLNLHLDLWPKPFL